MGGKFFARPGPGGDGDGARAEYFPAGDVVSGVADDIDLSCVEFMPVSFPGPRARKLPQLIAIVVVIRECTPNSKNFQSP